MLVRRILILVALAGGCCIAGPARAQASAPVGGGSPTPTKAVDCLPGDVLVAFGLREGDEHVGRFRALLTELDFYRSSVYRAFFRNTRVFVARVALAGLAETADTDEWHAVATLFGRDLAVGFRFGDAEPRALFVSVPRDPALAERLLRAVHGLAKPMHAGRYLPPGRTPADPIEIRTTNRREFHAFTGEAFLLSNDRDLLLDGLRARFEGMDRFSTAAGYRELRQTVPATAAAWGWADVATVRAGLQKTGRWPDRIPNPLFGFVAGGWWHHISSGERVVAWAMPHAAEGAKDKRIDVRFRVDGAKSLPDSHRGFLARSVPLRWAADALPRYVADLVVTRDWAELFSERESVLDRSGVADLAKFLTATGNFLGDLDLVEDVLPKMQGAMRLVVAEQTFPEATPTPTLPAFALVAPIRDPDGKLARQLEKAGQIAFTFANYQAMQQKKPTFMIETEAYRNWRVLSTFYDEIPAVPTIRFNFQPAIGKIADHYVIATSKRLLHRIADAVLSAGEAGAERLIPDALSIDAAAVARLFRANREPLVSNHMLREDVDRRRAEREVDGWIGVLDLLRSLDVEARTTAAATDVRLSLRFAEEGLAEEAGPAPSKKEARR